MLDREQQLILLNLAHESIVHGLKNGHPLQTVPSDFPKPLQEERACFVTLTINKALRGCIGHLEPMQSMVADVAENAFNAAFRDPRFPALSEDELGEIEIHISVLSIPEPLPVSSEQDLLNKLQPGIDGIILEEGIHRGTFLPSVWEQLPAPEDFLRHLKLKAGLTPNYWSEKIKVFRYIAESIEQ